MLIKINVTDRKATLLESPVLVCGNSTDQVEFTFDSEWGQYTAKTARFVYVRAGEVKYQDVPFTEKTANIPQLVNITEVRIGVFAEDLVTTTPAVVPCEKSIKCSTGEPEAPTADVYGEIMRLFNKTYIDPSLTPVDGIFDRRSANPQSGPAVAEAADAVIDRLEGRYTPKNILGATEWGLGYLANNGYMVKTGCKYGECTSGFIPVIPGEAFIFKYKVIGDYSAYPKWRAISEYDDDQTFQQRGLAGNVAGGPSGEHFECVEEYTVPEGVFYIRISVRSFAWGYAPQPDAITDEFDHVSENNAFLYQKSDYVGVHPPRLLPLVSQANEGAILQVKNGAWSVEPSAKQYENNNIKSINHRGFSSVAPENTLAAYRFSKKMGYHYVECDVAFTADGVPVLLHDDTIDRTSNGTGNINELSLEYLKTLDFGGWKGEVYAGEQIPTFEEFVLFCKRAGLHPYIEMKSSINSQDKVRLLFDIVKRNGMERNCTWISFGLQPLNFIKNLDGSARLGFVRSSDPEGYRQNISNLKTENNEVFLDMEYNSVTDAVVNLCIELGIGLEVWTVNNEAWIANSDGYISGFTSDELIAERVFAI